MIEIWRAVVGYEGLYEVSNWGRVKSLNYKHTGQERILKPQKIKGGYFQINLCKDGKQKIYYIHRLMAEAFIPNPDNLPCVNHKDENKENNFVFVREDGSVDFDKSNLEWITLEGNFKYGTARERVAKAKSKPVYQYTLDETFVREWTSTQEVQRQTGWSQGSISECCRGKRNHVAGYKWSYINVS